MKQRRILALLLALVLVFALAGCGKEAAPDTSSPDTSSPTSPSVSAPDTTSPETQTAGDADKYGGKVALNAPYVVNSLYTIAQPGNAEYFIFPAVERLGRLQLDGSYKPFLCDSWERDNSALTFTVNIHPGILFSDGSELTAEVLKWNFQMMVDNGMAASINNPTEFEVLDTYKLCIHFDTFSLEWETNYGRCFIYSQLAYDTHGLDYCMNNPVGTGPFVMSEYVPDNFMKFTRNDNYWQDGLPYLDSYEVTIIAEEMTMQSAFVNKEIDSIGPDSPTVISYMEGLGYVNKAVDTAASWSYFSMVVNSVLKDDPFYDVRVRQAVMLYGIDWDAVAYASSGGHGSAHLQAANEGAYDYNAELEKSSYYDLDKAKAMLAEAGCADGFKTEIIYASPIFDSTAAAMQDQLKSLGIDATVSLTTSAAQLRNEGTTPGIFMVAAPGAVDPTTQLNARFNRNGQFGRLMNFSDEYEATLAQVNSATTMAEKLAALFEINRLAHADESLHRVCYQIAKRIYIADDVLDSGFESMIYTPELTYRAK